MNVSLFYHEFSFKEKKNLLVLFLLSLNSYELRVKNSI